MAIGYGNAVVYNSVSEITGPTGWYKIRSFGKVLPLYIDQDYDGGGWILIFNNNRNTGGMNNLKWDDAMSEANYRWGGSGKDSANNVGRVHGNTTPDKFNCWIGLSHLSNLTGRKTAGYIEMVQFVSATKGAALSNTGIHQNRMTMRATGINATTGAWQGAGNGSTVAGSDGSSGFYSYMTAGHPLTTYDKDQDTNSGNCSSYYNNNPYWYTSCWSGNLFAGGGYQDCTYWTSSSSTYVREYGAVYVK